MEDGRWILKFKVFLSDQLGVLEKGHIFVINLFKLHRMKEYWGDDPDTFNPGNFTEENVAKRHPYAYVPFSTGPRKCIGYQQGLFNIKVMLVTLLSQFKFSTELTEKDYNYKLDTSLKVVDKYIVRAEERIVKK